MKVRFIIEFDIDSSSPNSTDTALSAMVHRLSQEFSAQWGIPAKRFVEVEETKVRRI